MADPEDEKEEPPEEAAEDEPTDASEETADRENGSETTEQPEETSGDESSEADDASDPTDDADASSEVEETEIEGEGEDGEDDSDVESESSEEGEEPDSAGADDASAPVEGPDETDGEGEDADSGEAAADDEGDEAEADDEDDEPAEDEDEAEKTDASGAEPPDDGGPETADDERGEGGVAAFFDHPDDLLTAARATRESPYEQFDAYSPFPIHGMDEAMGLGRSWIPWVTFGAGVFGFLCAVAMEFGMMTFDWPMIIGGKPYAPWPAFVPVMFELTVLISGVTTGVVMLRVAGCFEPADVIDPGLTDDRFALWISAEDPEYDRREAVEFVEKMDPVEVRTFTEETSTE